MTNSLVEENEWENKNEKFSHKNKTLSSHISEVKLLLRKFKDFYSISDEFYELAQIIAEYHDYGKLHKNWNINNNKNPSHSELSIEYILQNKEFDKLGIKKNLRTILLYLILKHHSSLSKKSKNYEYELIIEDVKNRLKNFSFDFKINLIDIFGLFKIADILSAENMININLTEPTITEENVKKIIIQGKKELDNTRWNEQIKLSFLPDIALLRAYTGWGKTDSSLLFFVNKNVKKVFYLFPTITAINKFYEKLRNVYNTNVEKYFYFYDTEVKEEEDFIQQLFFSENFLKPIILTTIDQFLLSFLQVGKYYTKRVMFRNAGIIIDEVHLLNPLMLYLFTFFINKYKSLYNLKILLMSATLSKGIKEYLKRELNLNEKCILDLSYGYKSKRRILFEFREEDIENAIEEIVKKYREGKKVLVIVNTVEKSIDITKKILEYFKDLIKDENIILLHARFMYRDRKRKEEKLENLKDQPHIFVATQVCEVSLDVSYDFMFTELAPLPSLIQRFGRVNRYGEKITEINVKIFKPKIKDKKHYPYSERELEVAEKIIKTFQHDILTSEMNLLEELDKIQNYENFISDLNKEIKKINLCSFENILQYFFSLDINEEDLKNLISYRESFTTLIIPSPLMIEEKDIRDEVEKIIKEDMRNKDFKTRKYILAKIKEICIPIPFWWLKDFSYYKDEKVFPIIFFKDKIYDKFYGIIEVNKYEVL